MNANEINKKIMPSRKERGKNIFPRSFFFAKRRDSDKCIVDWKYVFSLISQIKYLKNENEKLKSLAYKSYNDMREELAFEISRVTMEKDALLILMELRANKKLNYLELQDRITHPQNLFPRLSDLFNINFITLAQTSGDFSITSKGIEFLIKRGL